MTDLAESLVERGIVVTALAGRGRYNGGEKLPPYEEHKGVKIERAWATGFGKRNIVARLSDYLSFYLGASWKLLRLPKHDLVMALTTPPLIGLVAFVIGRMRGMRVIALVQDVYPDVAVALGALKSDSLMTRMLDKLNRLVLRGSDRVIVLGECMRELIAEKMGQDKTSRIDVIHNWADGAEITAAPDRQNPFTLEHNLSDTFVVLFSGNLGHVNEFATALEAALLLRNRFDIAFLFIGEGAKREEISRFIERYNLKNIRLLPYQPRHLLRHTLSAGDALLVTLAQGLAGLSVPSKTYGILAVGRPVLFVGDLKSDAARIVEEHDCGAVVAAGESERLAQMISDWAADRTRLAEMGANARALFEAQFCREIAVTAYLTTFAKCLNVELPAVSGAPTDATERKAFPVER